MPKYVNLGADWETARSIAKKMELSRRPKFDDLCIPTPEELEEELRSPEFHRAMNNLEYEMLMSEGLTEDDLSL
jgi:hypothetical protein